MRRHLCQKFWLTSSLNLLPVAIQSKSNTHSRMTDDEQEYLALVLLLLAAALILLVSGIRDLLVFL